MAIVKVSDQVRGLIEACPVSRHRLCALSGASAGNLAAFIAGRRGLSMETLDDLGLLLGFKVTMDYAKARTLAAEQARRQEPAAEQRKVKHGTQAEPRQRARQHLSADPGRGLDSKLV